MRAGLAALVGRPGVGKSALLNRLTGEKISIVTPIPLTTRGPVRGVWSGPDAQVVWIDTPALHRPRHRLGERMVRQAHAAMADADAVVVVADAAGMTAEDEAAMAAARAAGHPVLLALNKSDRTASVEGREGGPSAAAGAATDAHTVSASTGDGVDALRAAVLHHLPEGHEFFPPGVVTDLPEPVRIAELVREQVALSTRQEIPHAVAVETDEVTPREGGEVIYIRALLHVDREAQRKILIGAGGRMLKRIGQGARPAVERLLDARVYLDLWVKVTPRWYEREELLARLYPD